MKLTNKNKAGSRLLAQKLGMPILLSWGKRKTIHVSIFNKAQDDLIILCGLELTEWPRLYNERTPIETIAKRVCLQCKRQTQKLFDAADNCAGRIASNL